MSHPIKSWYEWAMTSLSKVNITSHLSYHALFPNEFLFDRIVIYNDRALFPDNYKSLYFFKYRSKSMNTFTISGNRLVDELRVIQISDSINESISVWIIAFQFVWPKFLHEFPVLFVTPFRKKNSCCYVWIWDLIF
jgi:hypothetical protein